MKHNPADLAWMAAVIDMKGHILRKENKTRHTPQVVLTVDTTDERIANRLARLTGTKPEPHELRPKPDFMRKGCTEHCPAAHIHVFDDREHQIKSTKWSITGAGMAVVLANLQPYMATWSDYRKETETAIAAMVTAGRGSGMVRASVHRLAELGWMIPKDVAAKLKASERPVDNHAVPVDNHAGRK